MMHCHDNGSATVLIVYEDGSVQIFTVIEEAIVPPWAKDPTGQSLPTHYAIKGHHRNGTICRNDRLRAPIVCERRILTRLGFSL
jgi:hypothetical protein